MIQFHFQVDVCIMCVQYIRGCSVHQGVFSTLGDIMSTSGDMMSTSGDIMMHVGDTMSKSGDVQYIGGIHDYIGGYHEYIGGYHEYIKGCSVHRVFNRNWLFLGVGYKVFSALGDIMMHLWTS